MGAHKNNPNSIAKAAGVDPRLLGEEVYGFDFHTLIQPNRAFMDEINQAGDRARLSGGTQEDERRAVHVASQKYNPREHPEHFDLVVFNKINVARPSALAISRDQQPAAFLLMSEHLRVPLADIRKRADDAFATYEAQQRPSLQ